MPISKEKNPELTDKQYFFVINYLKNPNATDAAIKAGYKKSTADAQGCTLLKNPKIVKAIELEKKRKAYKLTWNVKKLIQHYEILIRRSFGCIEENEQGIPVEYAYDPKTAVSVLNSIAKLLGLNSPEKKELTAVLLNPEQREKLLLEARKARIEKIQKGKNQVIDAELLE